MKLSKVELKSAVRVLGKNRLRFVSQLVDSDTKKLKPHKDNLDIELDLKARLITVSGLNPGAAKTNIDNVICIPLEQVAYFTRTGQSLQADIARAAKGNA